jgi:cell wall-associated NlpC family hydrolase
LTGHTRLAGLALAVLLGGCAIRQTPPAHAEPPVPAAGFPAPSAETAASAPPALVEPGPPSPLEAAVRTALAQVGAPYRFGGMSPAGFDCSGLVRYAFGLAGIELPRDTRQQRDSTIRVARSEPLQPGDLLFFHRGRRGAMHVAVYVGDRRFVHAPSRGGRVRLDALDAEHWERRFIEARRAVASWMVESSR